MARKKMSAKDPSYQETSNKGVADKESTTRERVFKLVHAQLDDFKNPANAVTKELNRPEVGEVLNLSITFTVGYGNMVAVGILYEKAPPASVAEKKTNSD
jgi:hypothetical protein